MSADDQALSMSLMCTLHRKLTFDEADFPQKFYE